MMSLIMSPCINWLWLGLIITSATALGGCVRRIATCMDQLQEICYTSSNQLGTPVPLRHDLWDSDYVHTYHTLFKRTRGTSCWNGYLAIPKRCHHGEGGKWLKKGWDRVLPSFWPPRKVGGGGVDFHWWSRPSLSEKKPKKGWMRIDHGIYHLHNESHVFYGVLFSFFFCLDRRRELGTWYWPTYPSINLQFPKQECLAIQDNHQQEFLWGRRMRPDLEYIHRPISR